MQYGPKGRWARMGAVIVLALIAGGAVLLGLRWPFTQRHLTTSLERATGSRVRIGGYQLSFFPEPGCTIEHLLVVRQGEQPIARAARVTIRSHWWDLLAFRKRAALVLAEGLQVLVPSPFPAPVIDSPGGMGE